MQPAVEEQSFPVGRCGRCDREVLTHVHLDDEGGERRLCLHCDAELDPAEIRWVPETELTAAGYDLVPEGGCGRPGCGRGNCANRR